MARRFLLAAFATLLVALVFGVRPPAARGEDAPPTDPALGITTIPLWPADDLPPGLPSPSLTALAPQPGRESGSAVVVAPGGAYLGLASNLEGREVADWFASRGITAFVLRYRVGPKNLFPAPLDDMRRALRVVRSLNAAYHFRTDRVGVVGFSAGGHLAAMAATSYDAGNPKSADPVDRLGCRPDFVVLGYPWLAAMQPSVPGYIPSYLELLKVRAERWPEFAEKYTPLKGVNRRTPPTFIFTTSDDSVVPPETSIDFYRALRSAGVSAELHIFRHGQHGIGLGSADPTLSLWTDLLEAWLRDLGFVGTPPKTVP